MTLTELTATQARWLAEKNKKKVVVRQDLIKAVNRHIKATARSGEFSCFIAGATKSTLLQAHYRSARDAYAQHYRSLGYEVTEIVYNYDLLISWI